MFLGPGACHELVFVGANAAEDIAAWPRVKAGFPERMDNLRGERREFLPRHFS